MTHAELIAAGCEGKQLFRTWSEAVSRAARIIRRQEGRARGVLAPYRCRWCGHWHIGNSTQGLDMGKHGPRRRDGRREPSGRLSRRAEDVVARLRDGLDRDEREVIAVGLEARERVHGVEPRHSRDQLAGSFIGRLCLSGEMTRIQYDAAQAWLKTRADYLLATGDVQPRPPGAVDLNRVHGLTGGPGDERARASVSSYRNAVKALQEAQNEIGMRGHLFGAIAYVVDRDLDLPHLVPDARIALNALARHYGLDRDRRAA